MSPANVTPLSAAIVPSPEVPQPKKSGSSAFPALEALERLKFNRSESIATIVLWVLVICAFVSFAMATRRFPLAVDTFPDKLGYALFGVFFLLSFVLPGTRVADRFGDVVGVVARANSKLPYIEPPTVRRVNFFGTLMRCGFAVLCTMLAVSAVVLINSGLDRKVREDQLLSWKLEKVWRGAFARKLTVDMKKTPFTTEAGGRGEERSVHIQGLTKYERRDGIKVTVRDLDRPDLKWRVRVKLDDFSRLNLGAGMTADIGQGFLSIPWIRDVRVADPDRPAAPGASEWTARGVRLPSGEIQWETSGSVPSLEKVQKIAEEMRGKLPPDAGPALSPSENK